jgi:uncharacterized repeat protein (TIGR01451 family)
LGRIGRDVLLLAFPAVRTPLLILALSFAVVLSGCKGDPTQAPAGLTYATNPATYTKGTAIASNGPTSTGGAVDGYAVAPALPAGLLIDPATGIVSGTPTAITGTAAYTVTAVNAAGSATAALSVTVNDVPPASLTYATNPAIYVRGTPVAPNLPTHAGGVATSWSVSPVLPDGLSFDGSTGILSGTPSAVAATANYTVTVTNSGGSTTATLAIRINDAPPSGLAYATNPATYPRGAAIAANVPSSTGGAVEGYAVTPALPAGLTLHPATGALSGTPTALAPLAGYTVVATNVSGSTQASLVLAVVEPPVASLAVTPWAGDVTAGGASVPLTARATFVDSVTTDVTSRATWTTAAEGQVDVTSEGVASAPRAARVGGNGTVTAAFGGQQASSTLRIVRGPPVGPLLGSDPLAGEQWYLVNTGQKAYSDHPGAAGEDLRLSGSQGLGLQGAGVKVAVVDTGLQIAHPDLAANVVPGSWNFVDDTDDPSPSNGSTSGDHGTSVSGIIGMRYDNAIGGMGVAPGVGLNGYNFLLNQSLATMVRSLGGSTSKPASDDVWIFNQSFGTSAAAPAAVPTALEAQYLAGVTTLRSGKGALYVKSAGNGFRDFGTASCGEAQAIGVSCQNVSMDGKNALPYNLVVGALNARGKRSGYSSAGSAIWVAAPGGEFGYNESVAGAGFPAYAYDPAMVTTDRTGCVNGYSASGAGRSAFNEGGSPNGLCDYANTFNGTSSAAPATVGAIALLLDARPDLTWRDVKHILATTARRVDPDIPPVTVELSNGPYTAELPWTQNATGRWFHNWYGFGAVDVDAAVTYARTYTANALGALVVGDWIASGAALGLAIPDDSSAGASSRLHVPGDLTVESIQIEVTITHAFPGDLGLELTSPSGSRSILLNIRNGFAPASGLLMVAGSNLFYGEPASGDWTVKVVDGLPADAGTLDQWKIRVFGH